MPSKIMNSVNIERAIHLRLRNEAARRKIKMQALASRIFHENLEKYEKEDLNQRDFNIQAYVGPNNETLIDDGRGHVQKANITKLPEVEEANHQA